MHMKHLKYEFLIRQISQREIFFNEKVLTALTENEMST